MNTVLLVNATFDFSNNLFLVVCTVVNGENLQSDAVTLTQCRTHLSYFHILPCVTVLSELTHYFLSFRVHRHTHTARRTQRHKRT